MLKFESSKSLPAMVRPRQLAKELGIGLSTIYRWIDHGEMPPAVPLGGRVVAWPRPEVEAMIELAASGHMTPQNLSLLTKDILARRVEGGAA